jgi:two-component system CheB/CheR fusion protein
MPESAIASGCIDLVLAPEEIALEIVRIARDVFHAAPTRTDR